MNWPWKHGGTSAAEAGGAKAIPVGGVMVNRLLNQRKEANNISMSDMSGWEHVLVS